MHVRREAHSCRESLTLVIQVNHVETSDPTTPAGNRDFREVDLDAIYEIKVSKGLGGRWVQGLRHVGLQSLSKSGVVGGKEGR